MAHRSEDCKPLDVKSVQAHGIRDAAGDLRGFNDVCLVVLPVEAASEYGHDSRQVSELVTHVGNGLAQDATLVVIGNIGDLVHAHSALAGVTRYQAWIAIKRKTILQPDDREMLPHHHFGALVHTKYDAPLRHTKTRVEYTYCPACDKTSKDYGGKKHTYHEYGTLMSDIWRDIACDPESDLTPVITRCADLFGIERYRKLLVLDCRTLHLRPTQAQIELPARTRDQSKLTESLTSRLMLGDCLERLREIPDNSIDFAFADPPYNLRKVYTGYADDRAVSDYFAWCDQWINELARVLRPGRTCAVLNIPLWAIRHFLHMEHVLRFQNWIAWDALSFPVRLLMPAHYTILCFTKGNPRALPGLANAKPRLADYSLSGAADFLTPLAEGYCLRQQCAAYRRARRADDRGPLTDLWWDIHRLKHNSRRVDHPCQLPPQLMYRLILLFTNPDEAVLDCFDGAGTTTLAAHQLGRRYVGIEMSPQYHDLAMQRHKEVERGADPFRKAERVLTAKNSPVRRMPKQKYLVPKKTLQLEVKRVAGVIGHLPTRDDMRRMGAYPIELYEKYFASWGEVCAAARTTGMSETRYRLGPKSEFGQLDLFQVSDARRRGRRRLRRRVS
jgi:site-specific DNA-methyltransferase (adenine-specific)